jgi:hypothetical protein
MLRPNARAPEGADHGLKDPARTAERRGRGDAAIEAVSPLPLVIEASRRLGAEERQLSIEATGAPSGLIRMKPGTKGTRPSMPISAGWPITGSVQVRSGPQPGMS